MNRLGYVTRGLCVGKSSGIIYNRVIILGSFAGSILATRTNKGMRTLVLEARGMKLLPTADDPEGILDSSKRQKLPD